MTRIRKKGVALVDTPKGILIVAGRRKIYALPGGGADKGESRKQASMRELEEETGLKSKSAKYLFSYHGRKWRTKSGRAVKNHAKVFLVNAYGHAKPHHEIKHIEYYKQGSKLRISHITKKLIEKYWEIIYRD